MLVKLIPLIIATGGVIKNKDRIKNFLDFTTVAGVQIEMSNICKIIKLDSIDGKVPDSDPTVFAEYLRQNIKSQDGQGTRDYSKDMWGMSYRIEVKKEVVTVLSAGPDKKFNTKDDLRASTDLF